MANIRCPTSVATECSTCACDRRSTKHDASRSTILIARFVAPSSSAPASDVIAPPSNAATTWRPSTASNPKISGIHSVCIGALLDSSRSRSRKTTFADSELRCAYLCEKCGLATALAERMVEKEFEFCVFDPEGDYDELEHAVSIGDATTPPKIDEALKLLRQLRANVVIN